MIPFIRLFPLLSCFWVSLAQAEPIQLNRISALDGLALELTVDHLSGPAEAIQTAADGTVIEGEYHFSPEVAEMESRLTGPVRRFLITNRDSGRWLTHTRFNLVYVETRVLAHEEGIVLLCSLPILTAESPQAEVVADECSEYGGNNVDQIFSGFGEELSSWFTADYVGICDPSYPAHCQDLMDCSEEFPARWTSGGLEIGGTTAEMPVDPILALTMVGRMPGYWDVGKQEMYRERRATAAYPRDGIRVHSVSCLRTPNGGRGSLPLIVYLLSDHIPEFDDRDSNRFRCEVRWTHELGASGGSQIPIVIGCEMERSAAL